MTQTSVDFAIVGASLQARLVAGLLSSVHGRRVALVGASQAGYRLPHGLDLSVAPITRPESWALLQAGLPELKALLKKLGARKAWTRLDPVFFAGDAPGRDLLAHLRHMAQAFGQSAERVPAALGKDREGVVLRDAVLLQRPVLEPLLDGWLDGLGVRRLDGATLAQAGDGSAELVWGEDRISARQTVLADDAAIITHCSPDAWPGLFVREAGATLLTEPTAPLHAPVMHDLDTGITLVQQAGQGLVALGPGPIDPFAAGVRVLLGRERSVQQVGQSDYLRVTTLDGAPAVGRLSGTGADVLAGFGPTAAFLAPSIARWLAGAGSPAENDFMTARLVDRALPSMVADWRALT